MGTESPIATRGATKIGTVNPYSLKCRHEKSPAKMSVNPTSADFKFPNAKRKRGEGNVLIATRGAIKQRTIVP